VTRRRLGSTLGVHDIAIDLGTANTLVYVGGPVTGAGLAGVVEQRWHHASPATWNRHVATVRSFAAYCARTRILAIAGDVELQRRAEKHDHTRSIALASLERLWGAATSTCASARCGGCCMRPPRAPTRSCA